MSVGDNIRHYRTARGMTQTQLATAWGESRQTVYKYESGVVENISIAKLELIARALGCDPADLAGWKRSCVSVMMQEDTAPYLTRQEVALLDAWRKAKPKERRIIACILEEYGMPVQGK